jgi:hypothetical protein
MNRSHLPRVATILVMGLATGCSWGAVTPPPVNLPESGPIECTESNAVPIVDTTGAIVGFGIAVLGTAALASANQTCSGQDAFCGVGQSAATGVGVAALVAGIVTGAVYLSSATYGFSSTARCRAIRASAQTSDPK